MMIGKGLNRRTFSALVSSLTSWKHTAFVFQFLFSIAVIAVTKV